MAKIRGGIDSKISGMIGPLVYVNFNGGSYVRMAPRARAKNSWKPKQVESRKRFSEFCAFWSGQIHGSLKKIWGLSAERMNGFNLFLKTNLSAFGHDGKIADLSRFHFTTGKLPLPYHLNAVRLVEDPGKVKVTWQDDSDSGLAGTKDEMMMIIAHEGKFTRPTGTGSFRKQGEVVIQLPDGLGSVEGIYLYFASKERELYSPDLYFGL